ncbi:hypothetical protein H4W34_001872 [Actinomadura algeriensis]|uniref:Uncharacterized protein n=1 Tax=Actinomadura algeriensis TaxID=1679523 RepID=A0ABR9JN93_9ACTN|nr:hypothetical protein [Actinomadura algeriensis]
MGRLAVRAWLSYRIVGGVVDRVAFQRAALRS